jgi:hypothetical protein
VTNVIGAQIPTNKRKEYWEAMRLFKEGSRELLKNPDTKSIALEDKNRYNRFLTHYIGEPIESSTRH